MFKGWIFKGKCFDTRQAPRLLTHYCSGDKIEEMGGACSAYGGEERHIRGYSGEI